MFQSAAGRILESDWFLFNYEFKFTIFFFVLLNTVFLMLITLSQEPSLSLSSGTDIDTLKSKSEPVFLGSTLTVRIPKEFVKIVA